MAVGAGDQRPRFAKQFEYRGIRVTEIVRLPDADQRETR